MFTFLPCGIWNRFFFTQNVAWNSWMGPDFYLARVKAWKHPWFRLKSTEMLCLARLRWPCPCSVCRDVYEFAWDLKFSWSQHWKYFILLHFLGMQRDFWNFTSIKWIKQCFGTELTCRNEVRAVLDLVYFSQRLSFQGRLALRHVAAFLAASSSLPETFCSAFAWGSITFKLPKLLRNFATFHYLLTPYFTQPPQPLTYQIPPILLQGSISASLAWSARSMWLSAFQVTWLAMYMWSLGDIHISGCSIWPWKIGCLWDSPIGLLRTTRLSPPDLGQWALVLPCLASSNL